MSPRRLPRSWFARDVLDVAPDLLGCTIEHAGVTVRVTETEAYGGWRQDPGSHAFRGETRRTAPMFGPAGVTYVYFTYGMHWMLCLVTGPAGQAQAVLVRAGEVIAGHPVAQARRVGVSPRDWTRGPGHPSTSWFARRPRLRIPPWYAPGPGSGSAARGVTGRHTPGGFGSRGSAASAAIDRRGGSDQSRADRSRAWGSGAAAAR